MNRQISLRPGLIAVGAAVLSCLIAAPAMAGRYDAYQNSYQGQDYGRSDYAQVLSAQPVYRQVQVSEPRRECWDERVTYREPGRSNNVAGAILGGIIGGVAGHQVGGGSGRDVATGVGAVIGASVGSQTAGQYNRAGYERSGYETRCQTTDNVRYEQRVESYDVTYRYNGQVFHTNMPYDPGNRMPVNVDVRPVQY